MLPIRLGTHRIRAAEVQCVKCAGDRLLRARRLLTPNSMGHHIGLLAEQTSTAGRVLDQQLLNHPTERLTLVGRASAETSFQGCTRNRC